MSVVLVARARSVCHAMGSAMRCAEAARAPSEVMGFALDAVRALEQAIAQALVDEDLVGRAALAYDTLERWRAEQGGDIPGYYLG